MKKSYILITLFSLFILGCGSKNNVDTVATVVLKDQSWTYVSGTGVDDQVVNNALEQLDAANQQNTHFAFNSIVNEMPLKKLDRSFSLDVLYSEGFADDTLAYIVDGVRKTYTLPYAQDNSKKLSSLECEGEKNYDSILCYMPRLDAVYGPFLDVFSQGKQLIYTVTSYQNLNTQHLLDLASQSEFPFMDKMYLLYFNDAMSRVYATEKTEQGSYNGLYYFENRQKHVMLEESIDMFFFDGVYLYAVQKDYSTDLSTISIFDVASGSMVHRIDAIDVGDKAEFVYKDNTLLVYYVDVSFIEEKEFYYVEKWDLLAKTPIWKISLP